MKTKSCLLLATVPFLALAACKEKSESEKLKDAMKEAAEEAGDSFEDAAKKIGDAVEDATD